MAKITDEYRGFTIMIEDGSVVIRNPYNVAVCTYAGRSVEFARKLIDDMLNKRS